MIMIMIRLVWIKDRGNCDKFISAGMKRRRNESMNVVEASASIPTACHISEKGVVEGSPLGSIYNWFTRICRLLPVTRSHSLAS